ncbi:hypothetical protein AcV7_003436 [Taiwanofungus camphoratus]|nr:hypothetical protein AcV7_003436 [Antrodia cinnamomea]
MMYSLSHRGPVWGEGLSCGPSPLAMQSRTVLRLHWRPRQIDTDSVRDTNTAAQGRYDINVFKFVITYVGVLTFKHETCPLFWTMKTGVTPVIKPDVRITSSALARRCIYLANATSNQWKRYIARHFIVKNQEAMSELCMSA